MKDGLIKSKMSSGLHTDIFNLQSKLLDVLESVIVYDAMNVKKK